MVITSLIGFILVGLVGLAGTLLYCFVLLPDIWDAVAIVLRKDDRKSKIVGSLVFALTFAVLALIGYAWRFYIEMFINTHF